MYDKKSERYDTPFFSIDDVNAKRKFVMAIHDKKTLISQFKDDFELVKLGSFNVIQGQLVTDEKKSIIEGKNIIIPGGE